MPPIDDVMLSPKRFQDVFRHFKGEPQQISGVWELYAAIKKADPGILTPTQPWFEKYTEKLVGPVLIGKQLTVPWFSQLDNASGQGQRECFSSSCAMLAAFHGKVKSDDEYNARRVRYGDTTDAQAQLAALRSLGLNADFRTDGTVAALEAEIKQGRPVATGWLHHGSAAAPSGGGHWTVVTGYTATALITNDPNGEADLVSGGYLKNTNGQGLAYSKMNWMPRWRVKGTGGWMLTVKLY